MTFNFIEEENESSWTLLSLFVVASRSLRSIFFLSTGRWLHQKTIEFSRSKAKTKRDLYFIWEDEDEDDEDEKITQSCPSFRRWVLNGSITENQPEGMNRARKDTEQKEQTERENQHRFDEQCDRANFLHVQEEVKSTSHLNKCR